MDVDRQHDAIEALQEENQRLREQVALCRRQAEECHPARFLEHAPAAIAIVDRDMRYIIASRRWLHDYGLEGRDIIGQSHYDVFPEISDAWKAIHQRALAGETIRAAEDRFDRADGSVQWLRWEVHPWHADDGAIGGIIMYTEDLTDVKATEERIRRQNRALRLLSDVNQALIRTDTEDALIQQVCEIAVEAGGYRMAWVGYLEQDAAKTVRPIAHAGEETGFLARHAFSWDAAQPAGRGPLGQAVRERRPIFADDFTTAPHFVPWHEDALAPSFRSGIALPLIIDQAVIGVFVLYRGDPYHFTDDETALLMELANDLAFGILTQRTRTAHRHAEEALRLSEAQYRTIVETAQEGIWMLDRDLRATYANIHLATMLGYPVEDIIARSIFDFIDSELHAEMARHIDRRRQGIAEVYEFRFHRRDGSALWTLISGAPIFDEHGQFAGAFGMLTDVTDMHQTAEYQQEFARRTIETATGGKLLIRDREAIVQMAGPPLASWAIPTPGDLERIRHGVADLIIASGMEASRVDDFLLCISEAATNACKHAGRGICSLHHPGEPFLAVIADNGPGIQTINLPALAVKPGYTTAVSLGMGFKAMIALADTVYLATGPDGTMVGLAMAPTAVTEPLPAFPGLAEEW